MLTRGDGAGALPHHSFDALRRLLDRLALDTARGGPPSRLDRAYWEPLFGAKGGSLGHQVVSTCRFFGLIEGPNNAPTETLWRLVEPTQRKETLRGLLEARYAEVLPVAEFPGATRKQLEQAFEKSYGVMGATSVKGVAFFIAASQYADLSISPTLIPQYGPTTHTRVVPASAALSTSDELLQTREHPAMADGRRTRQTTISEAVEVLEAVDQVHFRMAARKSAAGDWVVHTLFVDVFPKGWIGKRQHFEGNWRLPTFYHNYGRVAFLAGSIASSEARAWFLDSAEHVVQVPDQRSKGASIAFTFTLPKWQDYVQATRIPNFQNDGFGVMPWPHTLYNLTLGPTNAEAQDFDFLVAENCPFFPDFRTAVLSLMYGVIQLERAQGMSAQDAIVIRVIPADGWLERVTVSRTSLAIDVRGNRLLNSRILIGDSPEVQSEIVVHGAGKIKVPLPQGLPHLLWVVLARDNKWLDYVAIHDKQSSQPNTQTNIIFVSDDLQVRAQDAEIDPKEQVRELGRKVERAEQTVAAEPMQTPHELGRADEQSQLDRIETVVADVQEIVNVLSVSPRAALLLLSAKLEQQLYRRLGDVGVSSGRAHISVIRAVQAGVDAGVFPPEVLQAFRDFWIVRSRVAHDPGFDVDSDTIAVLVSAGVDLLRILTA